VKKTDNVNRYIKNTALILAFLTAVSYILFIWKSPVFDILETAVNTVEAESFTVVMNKDGKDTEYRIVIDFKNEDIAMLSESNAGNFVSGIYGGYYFECEFISGENKFSGSKKDITKDIETLFVRWNDIKNGTVDSFDAESVFDFLSIITGTDSKVIRAHIDETNLKKTVLSAFKILSDREWMTECLSHKRVIKTDSVTNCFDFNFTILGETVHGLLIECAKTSFAEFAIEDITRKIKSLESTMVLKTDLTTKHGYLKTVTMYGEKNGTEFKLEYEFKNIGKTKIEANELSKYIEYCI